MNKSFVKRSSSIWLLPVLAICLPIASSVMFSGTSYGQVSVNVSLNYTPPEWAPPYDYESTVRYYYLPDYDMYYDVWDRQYYYLNGGIWVASYSLPTMWADIPLSSSYIVLIEPGIDRPWHRHDFFARNYPHHFYDQHREIVTRNRIIVNVRPEHDLVPRTYNPNNRRATFIEHQKRAQTRLDNPNSNHGSNAGRNNGNHQQAHEATMKSTPQSRPAESRTSNRGDGQNRAPHNNPAAPRPQSPKPAPVQARPQNAPNRGNQGNGNQNKGNQGNGNQGNGDQGKGHGKDKH